MPSMQKLSDYATTVAGDGDAMRVTYHSAVIVEWTAETVTLRTGGWDTVTTRRKMNQASNQFGLGYQVFRHDGDSFVRRPDGGEMPLDSVTTFKRKG